MALSEEYRAIAEMMHSVWNYGTAIHDGNQFLGLIRLRFGDIDGAKEFLIRAGLSPGSPQLDSIGPQMLLARRLFQRGETGVVLKYIDLVARFWTQRKPCHNELPGAKDELLRKRRLIGIWKIDIAAGRVPR